MSASRLSAARAAAALAAILVLAALLAMPVRADTKSELNDAKGRLNELLGEIEAGQSTVAGLQSDTNALARRIDDVQIRIATTQGKIVNVQKEIKDAQAELEATQAQLDRRAWVAYENGPGTSVEFLLSSTSLADLASRLEIVDRAAQSDQDLITKIQGIQTKLLQKKAKLKALEADLRATRNGLKNDYAELQVMLAAEQAALDELARDKAEAAALVDKLEKKLQAEIEAEKRRLAELERQRRERERQQQLSGGGGTASGHPFSVCPVAGATSYSDSFGAPRVGHLHAGNDMFAEYGTPIVAPFGGSAADASNGIGGFAVKVYGSEGWVYNAHLTDSPINLGSVSAGTVIGYVGTSGNAQGTSPHDHFEWHPNNPSAWATWTSPYGYSILGDAVDPYPYLNQVCLSRPG